MVGPETPRSACWLWHWLIGSSPGFIIKDLDYIHIYCSFARCNTISTNTAYLFLINSNFSPHGFHPFLSGCFLDFKAASSKKRPFVLLHLIPLCVLMPREYSSGLTFDFWPSKLSIFNVQLDLVSAVSTSSWIQSTMDQKYPRKKFQKAPKAKPEFAMHWQIFT